MCIIYSVGYFGWYINLYPFRFGIILIALTVSGDIISQNGVVSECYDKCSFVVELILFV